MSLSYPSRVCEMRRNETAFESMPVTVLTGYPSRVGVHCVTTRERRRQQDSGPPRTASQVNRPKVKGHCVATHESPSSKLWRSIVSGSASSQLYLCRYHHVGHLRPGLRTVNTSLALRFQSFCCIWFAILASAIISGSGHTS